jgi:hypothetical protein
VILVRLSSLFLATLREQRPCAIIRAAPRNLNAQKYRLGARERSKWALIGWRPKRVMGGQVLSRLPSRIPRSTVVVVTRQPSASSAFVR